MAEKLEEREGEERDIQDQRNEIEVEVMLKVIVRKMTKVLKVKKVSDKVSVRQVIAKSKVKVEEVIQHHNNKELLRVKYQSLEG